MITKTREEAAQELIDWHFQSDPEITEVYRFIAPNEEEAHEPIKLVEVTPETLATGRVDTFSFRDTADFPYRLTIATITPEELKKIRSGQIELPRGWNLSSAQQLTPRGSDLATAGR